MEPEQTKPTFFTPKQYQLLAEYLNWKWGPSQRQLLGKGHRLPVAL